MELWELWPILPLLGTGILGALSSRALDELIRLEYVSYQKEWNMDGNPCIYGWAPPWTIELLTSWKSRWSRSLAWFIWLVDTPVWAKTDNQALAFLKRMRLFTLLTFIAFIGTFIIAVLYG